jgi:hypothetical protein
MDVRRLDLMEKLVNLNLAIRRGRSQRWCLTLWGRYIKARDNHRCVRCNSEEGIQAHHIFRRSLYQQGWYQPGNGITLCHDCHRFPHEAFNKKPDLTRPINAEGGDDLDHWAYFFWCLLEDADEQGLDADEFYYLEDHMLRYFVSLQGYECFYKAVQNKEISRIRMAYEIWRRSSELIINSFIKANMPEPFNDAEIMFISI